MIPCETSSSTTWQILLCCPSPRPSQTHTTTNDHTIHDGYEIPTKFSQNIIFWKLLFAAANSEDVMVWRVSDLFSFFSSNTNSKISYSNGIYAKDTRKAFDISAVSRGNGWRDTDQLTSYMQGYLFIFFLSITILIPRSLSGHLLLLAQVAKQEDAHHMGIITSRRAKGRQTHRDRSYKEKQR